MNSLKEREARTKEGKREAALKKHALRVHQKVS